jgi:hypothetical protein
MHGLEQGEQCPGHDDIENGHQDEGGDAPAEQHFGAGDVSGRPGLAAARREGDHGAGVVEAWASAEGVWRLTIAGAS